MPPDPNYSNPHLAAVFRRFSAAVALLMAVLGGLVLAGWIAGVDLAGLLRLGPAALKPLTALGLALGGVALWQLLREPAAAWQRRLGLICAGAAAALGGLVLLEYLLGVSLGLDQALAGQPALTIGRPGPATAGNLLLVGLALLALDPAAARRLPRWLAPAGLTLALVLSGLTLLGYVYDSGSISQAAPALPIEPLSALAGLLLALGVLAARPDGLLTYPLTTSLAGGSVSRRLLPAAILLPFVLGWLRLIGLRRGMIDIGLGGALYAAGNIVVFAGLVYWTAWRINQTEARREALNLALRESEERLRADIAEREHTEAALRQSEERFEKAFRASPAAVAVTRLSDGLFVEANDRFLELMGYTRDEVIGHTVPQLALYADPAERDQLVRRVLTEGLVRDADQTLMTKTREPRSVLLSLDEIELDGEQHLLAILIDNTERRRADEALRQLNAELEARVERRTAELAANEAKLRALLATERRQAQELTLRDRMHTALARELPLAEILHLMVEGIADTLGYTLVSLYLLEGDTLRLQHQVGYEHVIERVPIGRG